MNVEPESDPAPGALGLFGLVRTLLGYFRAYRGLSALVVGAMVVDMGADTALRLGFKFLIDDAIIPLDGRLLVRVLGALAAVVVLYGAGVLTRDYLYSVLGARVVNDIREHLFDHLQRLSLDFYRREKIADTMARFTTDLSYVETAVYYGLGNGIAATLGLLFTLGPMFALEWHLACLMLLCLPLATLGPLLLGPRSSQASYAFKESLAQLSTSVHENIGAQEVIKVFGLHARARALFRERQADLYAKTVRFNVLWYFSDRLPAVTLVLVNLVILGVGARLVLAKSLSVGALVSFHVLYLGLHGYAQELMSVVVYLLQAVGGMRRVSEVLDEKPTVADDGRQSLGPFERDIVLDNVAFGYTADTRQLDGLSLTIKKGESVAFVGASGSGKTTVLNLLLRFYDPVAGRVLIDGRDVREVTQASLRAGVGAVFQESFLFDTTIRENIRMGLPGASDAEVEAAAVAAGVDDFARKLPDGYETLVGERGARLSGGERQRVAIARAIVKNPSILVLDEATASLDAATAEAVNTTLRSLTRGRTVIAVSHHLPSVAGADRIFVFDRGRCVEQGRHLELCNKGGIYARLWAKHPGSARDLGERPRLAPAVKAG
ncbi:MAG TPA: ABC transporter ATP-binding protein [Polyangiaceae bacterium]|nr:ABC transporter ATP-binding protein [Polyangiaceae bacterium]